MYPVVKKINITQLYCKYQNSDFGISSPNLHRAPSVCEAAIDKCFGIFLIIEPNFG